MFWPFVTEDDLSGWVGNTQASCTVWALEESTKKSIGMASEYHIAGDFVDGQFQILTNEGERVHVTLHCL